MSEKRPVRTVALIGRRSGLTFAEFDASWRDVHAPLVAAVPGVVRYVQRHVVTRDGEEVPDNEFGIDGLAVLDYPGWDEMVADWASEAGQRVLADTASFIGRHHVLVVEDVVVADETSRP